MMTIPAITGDLGQFETLLYDPGTCRVVHADTNHSQGIGAPALDTASLSKPDSSVSVVNW